MPAQASPKSSVQPRATRHPWHECRTHSSVFSSKRNLSCTTHIRTDQETFCARRVSLLPPQAILYCPQPGCKGASRIRKLPDRSWKQHSQRQKHWRHIREDDAPRRFRTPLFPSLCSLRHLNWDFGAAILRCLLVSSICLPQLILSAWHSCHRERQPCPGPISTLFPTVGVRPTFRMTCWPCWVRHRAQARLPPQWQGATAPLGQPTGQKDRWWRAAPHHGAQPPRAGGTRADRMTSCASWLCSLPPQRTAHLSGKSP